MDYYLGIDIGTSTAKFTVIDQNGSVVFSCRQEYQYLQPQTGWREIWPEVWVEAVKKGLNELLTAVERKNVKAIGISGQMHTTVFLDEFGNCIRPAIMWNDVRTKEYFPKLKSLLTQEDTRAISAIISTGSPAVNLLWLKDYESENFGKLKKFLVGPDYLVYYLTGNYATDYCQASTSSLYDVRSREWSRTMRELIGLPEEVYPAVKGSQEIAGVLREELQNEFQLLPNVKVVVGTGDNCASAVATGSLQNGYPVLSIGTSGVLVLPKGKSKEDSKGKEILFSLDGKRVSSLTQGVVQSAGGSYEWFGKQILGIDDFNDLIKEISTAEPAGSQLLFYPHINGDKTIYADSSLRGAFIGLSLSDTREDLALAVMEGVSFAFKQLIQEMDLSLENLSQLMVTGGGANSEIWMQLLADILNIRIARLECNEGASYGAATLAMNAMEISLNATGNAVMSVNFGRCFEPRTYHVELYLKKYEKYLRIYDGMKMIDPLF